MSIYTQQQQHNTKQHGNARHTTRTGVAAASTAISVWSGARTTLRLLLRRATEAAAATL
jgi:hypothetical protein